MANNKFYGFQPKYKDTIESTAKLDKLNPYEFRKGMDYELTALGCSRLAESTIEEREKATESVLKNLEEHGGYYTCLITYETKYRNTDKKPSFKQWLAEQGENNMKEVGKEGKNDKMGDIKSNNLNTIKMKTIQPLKEAITKEIKNILSETSADDAKKINKDDAKKAASDKKDLKKHLKGKKGIDKQIQKLEDERKQKEEKRSEFFSVYKNSKKDTKATQKYKDKVLPLQDRIKEIDKEIKEIENQLVGIAKEEKIMRREAAGMMMDKRIHLEILEIIKEAGVDLREGAGGVKMYYEIAKTAYMEGLTAGLNKE